MLTSTPVEPVAPGLPVVPPGTVPEGTFAGTSTWTPSCTGAARFSDWRSAFAVAPPAVSIASMTRSPSVNSYTPGFRTSPATSTRSGAGVSAGDAAAATPGGGAPPARTSTGCGSDRRYQRPAPPSVMPTIATSPTSSPRESADRRSLSPSAPIRATSSNPRPVTSTSRGRGQSATLDGNEPEGCAGDHIRERKALSSARRDDVHELRRPDDHLDDLPLPERPA